MLLILIHTFFFFNDTATTEIYTLSLHDALPILADHAHARAVERRQQLVADGAVVLDEGEELHALRPPREARRARVAVVGVADRKSTRLNSSHANISYAVFCLKKKKKKTIKTHS